MSPTPTTPQGLPEEWASLSETRPRLPLATFPGTFGRMVELGRQWASVVPRGAGSCRVASNLWF